MFQLINIPQVEILDSSGNPLNSSSGALNVTQTNIPQSSATSTITRVPSSASSVSLLPSNPTRKGFILFNESTKTAYVKLGATASVTSYSLQMSGGSSLSIEIPLYTGPVDAIWAMANGFMQVTELT